MKKVIEKYNPIISTTSNFYLLIILFMMSFSLVFISCNSNFPESQNDPLYDIFQRTHFSTGTTGGDIIFNLPGVGNKPFTVIVYPQWIAIKKHEGKLDYDAGKIPFEFEGVEGFMSNGRATGYVYVKVQDTGIFRITISYGNDPVVYPPAEEQPPMSCSTAEINFGIENTASFTIANSGISGKNWHIENIPSWLELSSTMGNLQAGSTLTIQCNVNRQGLSTGSFSQIMHVESDNPQLSHGILVSIVVAEQGPPVNTATQKWIQGTVQDAFYSKASDVLYILTKSPNSILVKASQSDSLMTYPLERVPNCIDVTADGKTIAIGYNQAYVDLINAETLQRIKLYETDCVPFDIVFGENGWCYLAPDEDQWVYFYSLNLASGVTFRNSNQYTFYEKSVLKKMPGKPLIYSTCKGSSPSGLQIINITGGRANDTIPKWHEEAGSDIWFTEDGTKIIAGDKEVHKTPAYTTESLILDLPETGRFDIPRSFLQSLDYNSKLHCFFAVGTDSWYIAENSETIFQVNEISYVPEKMVKATPYPGVLKNVAYPDMDIFYVFSNTAGTQLLAVKNVQTYLSLNVWALEMIELPLK